MIFRQPPRAGDAFKIDEREMTCIGHAPHTTRDQREIVLVEWSSVCATCPNEFTFKTTLDPTRGARRCRQCVDARPKWSRTAITPDEKKQRAIARRSKNAKISVALKAHHDRRLGRNEL